MVATSSRAVPDKPLVEEARKLRLTVAVTTKLNRGHLVHGKEALILPCLARSEIDFRRAVRNRSRSKTRCRWCTRRAAFAPGSEHLKSEVAIGFGMARATLTDTTVDWQSFEDDYDLIRDKIEEVFPDLFTDFNSKIRKPGGFRLANGASERVWRTSTGKARFIVFRGVDEDPPVPHPEMLRLATIRSHDQYNTTIYSMDDRYRGVYGTRTVVFMNKEDMAARHRSSGARRDRSAERR
jgi:anaerobic selenocysteine-containing dehydrogenase